jgi:nitroreductase/dihydropteridine reductase
MDILASLNWRYAVKNFDPSKKIPDGVVHEIIEAARLTSSSFGMQTWKFLLIENQAIKDSLVPLSWNQKQIAECSHLLILCAPTQATPEMVDQYMQAIAETRDVTLESLAGFKKVLSDFITRKDVPAQQTWMDKQLYIVLGNLLTVCALKGIDSCPMEGFQPKKYDEVLGLTQQGLRSVLVLPMGYRSQSDKYSQAKKVRYPLSEVLLKM